MPTEGNSGVDRGTAASPVRGQRCLEEEISSQQLNSPTPLPQKDAAGKRARQHLREHPHPGMRYFGDHPRAPGPQQGVWVLVGVRPASPLSSPPRQPRFGPGRCLPPEQPGTIAHCGAGFQAGPGNGRAGERPLEEPESCCWTAFRGLGAAGGSRPRKANSERGGKC